MTVVASPPRGHIVLFAYGAWGHTRPLCSLAAKIVRLRGAYITILTIPDFLDRVKAELARNFEKGDEELHSLIRVIALNQIGFVTDTRAYHASFAEVYSKLVNSESVTCNRTGVEYAPLPPPSAVMIDFFGIEPLRAIRERGPESVKVIGWFSAAASGMFRYFGPEERGGRGDVRRKAEEEAAKTGRSVEELIDEIAFRVTGRVVEIASLPPMYDHEFHPQTSVFQLVQGIGSLESGGYELLLECDAVLLNTSEPLEPEANAALREWFGETSRNAYICGPLLSSIEQANTQENQGPQAAKVVEFLDSIAESHGEKSLVYVSFGTFFWSVEPEKIWAFLDVLMEKKIPFLLSHASPLAVVPDTVVQKVKDYGLGHLSSWSPQQLILGHKATGWFVTHGGHNSVTEAVSLGVPMICWPYHADQPTNTITVTLIHDAGYELFEVRTGPGLKPLLRLGDKAPTGSIEALQAEARDVLDKAFGEDGQKKRQNLQRLRKEVQKVWEEDGSSQRDLEALLSYLKV